MSLRQGEILILRLVIISINIPVDFVSATLSRVPISSVSLISQLV